MTGKLNKSEKSPVLEPRPLELYIGVDKADRYFACPS